MTDPLRAHWQEWLGADAADVGRLGRPEHTGIRVVGSAKREAPAWDGQVRPVAGVVDPYGNAVVSLPPRVAGQVCDRLTPGMTVDRLREVVGELLAGPDQSVYRAVCRWAVDVPPESALPPAGGWVPVDDPRVPEWLRPFGGPALLALDGDRYLAGVGLKRHDSHAHEISVGTDEHARGRGLARRLVAQAARELLASGRAATYLHDPANVASARVADAAGFPDRGWTVLGLG